MQVSEFTVYTDVGMAGVRWILAEGTTLQVSCWRLVKDGKERISSFDHGQKYACLQHLELQKELRDKTATGAQLDKETGDLILQFTENIKLQAFAFSGFEVWEIHFADGTGEYSNFA